MIQGTSELAAVCVGLVGLIGTSAVTGLPMWKVTAFIGANIIVFENRWEGLWMNCYRQANIRMQCKVYDSLLYLPPDLQAARGLMCTAVAFSGLGLLVALAGMRCVSCIQGNDRVKAIILMTAGVMQFMACICVFIPVSWTGYTIVSDFYNPLLIDAQRRELGAALYIGWVTGAVLFASSLLFVCRNIPTDKNSRAMYRSRYKPTLNNPALADYQPFSTLSSFQSFSSAVPLQKALPVMTNNGAVVSPHVAYNLAPQENAPLLYQSSMAPSSSVQHSNHDSLYSLGNSLYISQNAAPYALTHNPTASFQSSLHPVLPAPAFGPVPHNGRRASVYI